MEKCYTSTARTRFHGHKQRPLSKFIANDPDLDDYWRAIVLLGRNVASYKFALAKTLLELNPVSGQLIRLEEIAPHFAKHVCDHLKFADKQATSRSSRFLDACRNFNTGAISRDELTGKTIQLGFANVIDAYHVVGSGEVSKRFYLDERKQNSGIRITDNFSSLGEGSQFSNLPEEVEARWRLVETAWEMGVTRSIVSIQFEPDDETLSATIGNRRKNITSSRDALNGYQRGKCFYCHQKIQLEVGEAYPDVDHFHPHVLKQHGFPNIDGVWNLVLACKGCNRGSSGKFAEIPKLKYLEKLSERNEFLITSHHPMRETLIQQTGKATSERKTFLNDYWNSARNILIHTWEPAT